MIRSKFFDNRFSVLSHRHTSAEFYTMQKILEWLNGPQAYEPGVELYSQYGSDALLKMLFAEGWSDFKQRRLVQALEELATTRQLTGGLVKIIEVPVSAFTEPGEAQASDANFSTDPERVADLQNELEDLQQQIKEIRKGWPAVMDDQLQPLHDEWKVFIAEKYNLQARIYEVSKAGLTDDAKRQQACTMAHRILDLRDACRAIYVKRDHYLEHGSMPVEQKPDGIVQDPKKWPLKLANHQKYLRDYRAKFKAEGDPEKRDGILKQINKHQALVDAYKKLLGE